MDEVQEVGWRCTSNHFKKPTLPTQGSSAHSESHNALAFPMALLITQHYFYLYFDFVLCSILPNLFSFKSHCEYVNSLVTKAFGGEETSPKWAENKSNQSYSRLQGDLNSQDGSTLDSDLIHLRGINRVFSEGVAPTDPDPGKEPCKLCLQALIPLIPDISSFKWDFDWQSALVPRLSLFRPYDSPVMSDNICSPQPSLPVSPPLLPEFNVTCVACSNSVLSSNGNYSEFFLSLVLVMVSMIVVLFAVLLNRRPCRTSLVVKLVP